MQEIQVANAGYAVSSFPPVITTGTTNIIYGNQVVAQPTAPPEPELLPLEWLREEVGEVCELARAA